MHLNSGNLLIPQTSGNPTVVNSLEKMITNILGDRWFFLIEMKLKL